METHPIPPFPLLPVKMVLIHSSLPCEHCDDSLTITWRAQTRPAYTVTCKTCFTALSGTALQQVLREAFTPRVKG